MTTRPPEAWLIFERTPKTDSGRSLIFPREPAGRSVRMIDHDPRHYGDSLEEIVQAMNPQNGAEFECYRVDDDLVVVAAERPKPTPVTVIRLADPKSVAPADTSPFRVPMGEGEIGRGSGYDGRYDPLG